MLIKIIQKYDLIFVLLLSYNPDYELVKDKLIILNDLVNDQ